MRLMTPWILYLTSTLVAGCATGGKLVPSAKSEVGYASFYAHRFHGAPTASGELYDESELTAAHRTLPLGTRVRVTNLRNDKSVVLTINDRGPWLRRRIIDVSRRAARELGFIRNGIARVRVEVLRR